MHDKGVHVSTQDETLGEFKCSVSLRKIDEKLANAVGKYNALVEDDSSVADLPLLVAFTTACSKRLSNRFTRSTQTRT